MSQAIEQPTTSAPPGNRRRADIWRATAVCVFLALAVLLVFGRTFWQGILNYDDDAFVFREPHVSAGFSWSGVGWALTNGPGGDWYPLAMFSHMLDCQLYGLRPAGHHLTNVLLHAAAAVSLFLVLWRMTGQRAVPGTDRRLVAAQASDGKVAAAGPSATTPQQAVPEAAQVSDGKVAAAGPSATTERAVPEAAQASDGRVAPAGPSATTPQRAVPEVAQASGGRVAAAGPSATTLWPSALVAALFALHPLHVESVAWIAERRDVLSGLFFMLTLGAYDEYSRHPRSLGRYLAVCGLFTLGLMAKPMLVTLPPLLLLLDYWPLGRFRGAERAAVSTSPRPTQSVWWLVLEKLPLVALPLAAALMTILGHAARFLLPLTLPERLANAAVSCVAYLGQLFVPVGLSVFYSFPEAGWSGWQVASAALVLLAITAAAVIYRRACPYLFVGWFWYLGMLVPVLGIFSVGDHARADRYTYLSQIGLYIALVWGWLRNGAAWPDRRWVCGLGSALVLAFLMACSWRQVGFWRDSQTLWEHALACDETNVTARYQLGLVWLEKDKSVAADYFRQVLERNPHERNLKYVLRAEARECLGDIAAGKGDFAEAIADYQQALESEPLLGGIDSKLAMLLANQGKLTEASAHCQRCIQLTPDDANAYGNLAIVLALDGKIDEAQANFRKALTINPRSNAVQREFAAHLAKTGDVDEAIVHFRRAVDVDSSDYSSCREIARLLREQGKSSEAIEYDERAVVARRRWAQARNVRGRELAAQGRFREAIAQFQAVIAAVPGDAQAHCDLPLPTFFVGFQCLDDEG